jgi:hypothetical protein
VSKNLLTHLMLTALLLASCGALAGGNLQQLNLTLVDRHLLPRYQQLADAAMALQRQADTFCRAPDERGLAALHTRFHQTMDAWMGIQHIRFGTVTLFLRYNRFEMWPDKHNTGSKQLRRMLAAQDLGELAPDRFPYGSVAVQGLSALERLLFNDKPLPEAFGSADRPSYRCRLVQAIGANLARMSEGILADWSEGETPYREVIRSAEQGNDYFESSDEVATDFLNNLYTQLQAIVDQKLRRPLGDSAARAAPQRAESWRSRRSLRNIEINLEALQDMYLSGFQPMLADKQAAGLDRRIVAAFEAARAAARAIDRPLYEIAADETQRPALDRLLARCSDLKRLIGDPLPKALGIPLGFNSLDGD